MAEILKGAPVAKSISDALKAECDVLRARGTVPTLAIVRVGERADDLSYERGAMKRCAGIGIEVRNVVFAGDVTWDEFAAEVEKLNEDPGVHGILMFRPLPPQLDNEAARRMIRPDKDVDGCTDASLSGVFTNTELGFPPCTAQAVTEILDYYGYDCKGKRAAVIGRSLVIGRPVAMMLMHKNATVAICHTKTVDMPSITKAADLVVVAAGKMETIGAEYFTPGQTVIDVGIGWNEAKGKLCGDVIFDEVEPVVAAITPVPGGVGSVTTSVLAKHVIEAAGKASK